MELRGKKVIALGERDGVPGEAIAECVALGRRRGRHDRDGVLRLNGGRDAWTRRTRAASSLRSTGSAPTNMVVVLGAGDPWALEMAATTVTDGDPSFVGPLAGVQLGLPVMHIFEDEVKRQVDAGVYEAEIGFLEMTLDADSVKDAMRRLRPE